MTIDLLDHLAYHSDHILNRATPSLKLLLTAGVLACVITSANPIFLMILYFFTLEVMVVSELPLWPLLSITLYPLVFVAVFGLSLGWSWSLMLIGALKVLTASTALVTLTATTPYPAIFKTISPLISQTLASILLLSYRALFTLMQTLQETIATMRLRGAFRTSHPMASLHNLTHALGVTVLKAITMSEKTADTMRLRGFTNHIYYTPRQKTLRKSNLTVLWLILLLSILVLIGWSPQ